MPRPLSLAAVPAVALLGLAAIPAAGSAATIVPSAACYATSFDSSRPSGERLQWQPMTGTITGGTPGGRFQIYGVGGKAGSQVGTFDAAGNAPYTITSYSSPGISPSAGRTVRLEVTEFVNGTSPITGATTVKVTSLAADVASRPSSPRRKRVVRVSGTPYAGQSLYGFVVRGKKGSRVLKRISLGRANACGYARTRAVVAPRSYRTGTYTLYINPGKKLQKSAALGYSFRITRRYF
jgi:hypothetical protein